MPRPPVVKSFLIADSVIHDRITGKWSIVGVFDRVMAAGYPTIHQPLAFYIKVADAEGIYKIRVELRDADDRRVGIIEGIQLEVKISGHAVDIGFPAPPLPLERPGKYQFQLYANDEFLASVPLEAVLVQGPPRPPAPSA
ncbi:MAG TPA: hypothetical protein VNM14_11830 [Planctomycetota bacterium]|jgi:hypothetical protein|nr:hypothetical protein [Planctomycetota bacterium]